MAYMDDQAIEREMTRQRLLAGKQPLLGEEALQQLGVNMSPAQDATAQAPPGVRTPLAPGGIQELLKTLSLTPKGVNVTPTKELQAPQVAPRISAPGTSQWQSDNSIGNVIESLLGSAKGGGIQDMLARLRAEQAKRAAPTGSVVRGQDLPPPPGTKAAPAPAAPAAPPGPPPAELIPGLRQPPAEGPAPPAAGTPEGPPPPEAGKPYEVGGGVGGTTPQWFKDQQQVGKDMAPGPAVTGVPKPDAAAAAPRAPGASASLVNQRADYAKELAANPAAQEKLMGLMLAEEGGDPKARVALAETVFNRGNSRGVPSIDSVMDPRYYQPMSDGSGNYEKAVARVRADPKLRAQLQAEISQVTGGSNVSNLATDNASGSVARNSKTNQTLAYTGDNGEGFFRKDVRPDVHGAAVVAKTKDWYNNSIAAMADEKPDAPAAPATAAAPATEPPAWAQGAVSNYAAAPPAPPPPAAAQALAPVAPPPAPPATAEAPAPQMSPTRPAAPTGLAAAHQMLDTKVTALVQKFAPDQASRIPGFIGDKTLRQAMNMPLVGGQIRSAIEPHLGRMGTTPKEFDDAVKNPPAPGKQSDLGTSGATDFSARARTPGDLTASNRSIQPAAGSPPPTPAPSLEGAKNVGATPPPPQIAAALEAAVKSPETGPPLQPQPDAQPVVQPGPLGGGGGPGMPLAPAGLQAGNAGPQVSMAPPQLMPAPGSQGGGIAMAGVAGGAPVAAEQPAATPFQGVQPPIPWEEMQGWGWGGMGGMGGFGMAGGD